LLIDHVLLGPANSNGGRTCWVGDARDTSDRCRVDEILCKLRDLFPVLEVQHSVDGMNHSCVRTQTHH
jgi:hypothetical protein